MSVPIISTIQWVLVRAPVEQRKSTEFDFALAELRRQLPPTVQWCWGEAAWDWNTMGKDEKVLCLEHPWLTLEARCLERLEHALHQGFDIAQACDSRHPAPMPPPDYATLRGIERYVDKVICTLVHSDSDRASDGVVDALVQLGTVSGFQKENPQTVRVVGAYAHDVSGYFGGDRSEVLPLIPASAQRFLDVGGGEGRFLAAIKAMRPTAHTQLVEMDAAAAQLAQQNHQVDSVWNGDFLGFTFDKEAGEEAGKKFDCISFLDMLEHVVQPETCLMHAKTLLSESGVVIASIPNVGHWSVVADLLEGRWDYVPAGIHCVTHLRFFTEQSVRDLFDRAGLSILAIERTSVPCPPAWFPAAAGLTMDAVSLDTYAFLVVAS